MQSTLHPRADRLGKLALFGPILAWVVLFVSSGIMGAATLLPESAATKWLMIVSTFLSLAAMAVACLSVLFNTALVAASLRGDRSRMWRALGGLALALTFVVAVFTSTWHVKQKQMEAEAWLESRQESPTHPAP